MDEWIIPVLAIGLVTFGLIGQGFEMRKIRLSTRGEEVLGSPKIFIDKRNFKWYLLIGAGIVLWYSTGGIPS